MWIVRRRKGPPRDDALHSRRLMADQASRLQGIETRVEQLAADVRILVHARFNIAARQVIEENATLREEASKLRSHIQHLTRRVLQYEGGEEK